MGIFRDIPGTRNSTMNILLYGYGFVGKAHFNVLRHNNYISIIDPQYPNLAIPEFEAECAVICVSTPEADSGACDMSNVMNCLETIPSSVPVLIKSTISLEGWRQIKESYPEHSVNFSPEFLRADSHIEDIQNATIMYLSDENSDFWISVFENVLPNINFITAEPEELILIKYFKNAFLASKVSFFNQIYDMCQATGIDYNAVAEGIAQDERIGYSHVNITPERGWGGFCFPKDTRALLHTAKIYDVDLSILKEVRAYNTLIRKE